MFIEFFGRTFILALLMITISLILGGVFFEATFYAFIVFAFFLFIGSLFFVFNLFIYRGIKELKRKYQKITEVYVNNEQNCFVAGQANELKITRGSVLIMVIVFLFTQAQPFIITLVQKSHINSSLNGVILAASIILFFLGLVIIVSYCKTTIEIKDNLLIITKNFIFKTKIPISNIIYNLQLVNVNNDYSLPTELFWFPSQHTFLAVPTTKKVYTFLVSITSEDCKTLNDHININTNLNKDEKTSIEKYAKEICRYQSFNYTITNMIIGVVLGTFMFTWVYQN